MLGQKKRNPDPVKTKGDDTATAPPVVIPPLRTFIVYGETYGYRPRAGEVLAKDDVRGMVVEAHGVGVDESRMLSFVVFYFYDGDPSKPANAQKLILNSDEWAEIEELNLAFPTLQKH